MSKTPSAPTDILHYVAPIIGAEIAGYAMYQLPLTSMSGIAAGGGYLAGGMIAPKVPAVPAVVTQILTAAAAAQYLGGEGLGMQEGVVLGLGSYAACYLAKMYQGGKLKY